MTLDDLDQYRRLIAEHDRLCHVLAEMRTQSPCDLLSMIDLQEQRHALAKELFQIRGKWLEQASHALGVALGEIPSGVANDDATTGTSTVH